MNKRESSPPQNGNPKKHKQSGGVDEEDEQDEDASELGSYGRASDYINDTESDSEGEAPTEQMQALTVYQAPVIPIDPRWHVEKQNNCINAVLGYLVLKNTKQNAVLSPFSLMSCMAMMCRGASRVRNNALPYKQLAHYCWPTDDARDVLDASAHAALKVFVAQLTGNPACNWKNIIMSDNLKEDYVSDIKTNFKALEKKTDDWELVNAEVTSVTHMNSKVLDDKPSGSVLINAIYFQDQWIFPFDKVIKGMQFKSSEGTISLVKMMTLKQRLRIAKHGHMTAVNMLYETPGLGAWFVKNSDQETGFDNKVAFNNLTSFLNQEFVDQTLTSSQQFLEVKIPQFKLEESINLKQVFQSLPSHAITEIFRTNNLDRMTQNTSEAFSMFRQDCMLKVDRLGTTAAARTVGVATRGSRGPTYLKVTFAHTFYMVIYHFDTILFVAKIGCPQDHADSGRSPATDEVVDTVHGHVSSHYADQEMALQLEYQTKKLKVVIGGIERSIKIVTKLHDGKNDEVGEVIVDEKEDEKIIKKKIEDTTEMVGGSEFPVRTYTVDPDLLISVTVKFPTPAGMSEEDAEKTKIRFTPVYVKDTGEEEPEDPLALNFDQSFELPFPLQKVAGEEEDGWSFKDYNGKTFLKLRFKL
jgi:serine protease inhibitor